MGCENIMNIYNKNKIYTNKILNEKISGLEEKYNIVDYTDKYRSLVNFSQNKNVPFHQWFRYREGFSSALIEDLIKKSGIEKGGFVIDPFAGSGTAPVVASLNGYIGFGIDVNPMSAFISGVKIRGFTNEEIEELEKYNKILENEIRNLNKPNFCCEDIKMYFNDDIFYNLLKIKTCVLKISNEVVKDIYQTAFLSIIEDSSNRKRDGNGLKKSETKVDDVIAFYIEKVEEITKDIRDYANVNRAPGASVFGNALEMHNIFKRHELYDENKDKVIIFSPPYANSFDYFESYKLELVLGGFSESIKDISKLRRKAIRSFVGVDDTSHYSNLIDMLVNEVELAIPIKEKRTGRRDSRTRRVPAMLQGYFFDMWTNIKECYKTLNKGNKLYIVVDQSSYLGVIIPTDLLLSYFAEKTGFKVNVIYECRKARTSPQQSNQFPYLKEGLREVIIELEK